MKEKVKVLFFVDNMEKGGIQSFILQNIEFIDKTKIKIDVLLLDDGKEYKEDEDKLRKMGCNIYVLNKIWIRTPIDYFRFNKSVNIFFENHSDYDVIHYNSSSKNFLVLKYAKKYNIRTRIVHSHNIDFQTNNLFKKIVGNCLKFPLKKYSTDFFACSELAGKWLFGKKIIKQKNFYVVPNAINIDKFRFNQEKRNKIRSLLDVKNDTFVIGNIARFTNQKNHEFLLKIYKEVYEKNKNTELWLIGTGENKEKMEKMVYDLNIQNNVKFLGVRENVNEYLSAMDSFVLPSKYEGLGIVLIEAQTAGLRCYTSEKVVPKEANVSGNLNYISLNENECVWANEILKDNSRLDFIEIIKKKGYDVKDTAIFLQKFYINKEILSDEEN